MTEDTIETKVVDEVNVNTLKALENQAGGVPKKEKWRRSVIERNLDGLFDMPEFSSSDEKEEELPEESLLIKPGSVRIHPNIRHAEGKVIKDVAKTMLTGLWKSESKLDETVQQQFEVKTKETIRSEGAEVIERSKELEPNTNAVARTGRNRAARDRRTSAPRTPRANRDALSAQSEPSTSPRQRSQLSGQSGEDSTGARRRSQRKTGGVDSTELKGFNKRATSDENRRISSGSQLPTSRNSDSSGVGGVTHRRRSRRTGSEVAGGDNSRSVTLGNRNDEEITAALAVDDAIKISDSADLPGSTSSLQRRSRTARKISDSADLSASTSSLQSRSRTARKISDNADLSGSSSSLQSRSRTARKISDNADLSGSSSSLQSRSRTARKISDNADLSKSCSSLQSRSRTARKISDSADLSGSSSSLQSRSRSARRLTPRSPRKPGSDTRSSEISRNEHISQNSHDNIRSSPRSHVRKGRDLPTTSKQGSLEHDNGSRSTPPPSPTTRRLTPRSPGTPGSDTRSRLTPRSPRKPGWDARSSEISRNEHINQNSHDNIRSSPRSYVRKGKDIPTTSKQGSLKHDHGSRSPPPPPPNTDQTDLEKAKVRGDSHLDSLADDLRKEYGLKEELPDISYYATGHIIINRARLEQGLKPLARITEMDAVARKHAEEMAAGSILVWRRPTKLPYQGYIWRGASILSVHEEVMEDERGSARAHILHPAFEKIGVGTAIGSDGMLYLCELYDGPEPLVSVDGTRQPFVVMNEMLGGVTSSLRYGVAGVTTNLRGGVTGITSNVRDGVSSVTTNILDGVSGVTSNLRDGVSGVSSNVRGGVSSLFRKNENGQSR